MSCKTKPCQSSRESLRMVRAMPPDTPRPPKFQVVQFPETYIWSGLFFGKFIYLTATEMGPWLKKKSEDQSGGPRTNLEVFGDEVSFQNFQKHENRLSPCHVRPNPAKVRGNRFVWSMPCPQTPLDLPNPI